MADEIKRILPDNTLDIPSNCPECGAKLTFRVDRSKESAEIWHPRPVCSGFQLFVKRLFERNRDVMS